ncbi:DMT family transporter [Aceticella autotrophica]|uniref:DMT family transporter n=1 Tax=Aceticella autotrophica TaxID=2755338 RepID=A0A975AXL6_9THEO|nr:DMT family transporter [Aceticella autotrophica]QSZ28233.1 DMT family transporter [Aceticella autotrophica]
MERIKSYYPYLAGIGMASIFGFSFLFTSIGLDIVPPMELIAYRFLIAATLLTLLWFFKLIKLNYKGKNMWPLFFLSLSEPVIYFVFETYGVKYTSSSLSGLMISLIPVAVTILAVIFLNERPSLYQLLFIILSVIGVVFIILMTGIDRKNISIIGFIYLLGAVLSAAIYTILARRYSLDFSSIEITFVMMWFGAVFFNLFDLKRIINKNFYAYFTNLLDYRVFIPVLYLGILSSVVAYILNNFILSKLPVSQASVFANLTTIISIIAGVVIRHETFYWYHVIGSVMILVGIWGTNHYSKVEDGMFQTMTN